MKASITDCLTGFGLPIQPFQREFIKRAFAPGVFCAALTGPRGIGKTTLLGAIAGLALRPGSPLYEPGREVVLCAASIAQGKPMFEAAKRILPDHGDRRIYKWQDNHQTTSITRKACRSSIRIISSSGKRAMGLGGNQTLLLFDEPASCETVGGKLLFEALYGSVGKIENQRLIIIGTLSPSSSMHWWPRLIRAGSMEGVYVQQHSAPESDDWTDPEVAYACNPLSIVNPTIRAKIRSELKAAQSDPDAEYDYRARRLNQLIAGGQSGLVTPTEWQRVLDRDVPDREGQAACGLDVGASFSMSAAWCLWANGRSECYGVVPGIPDLHEQERAQQIPAGTLQRMVDAGSLVVDAGVRMSRVETLVQVLRASGADIRRITCDRFHFNALLDAIDGAWPVEPRTPQWSTGSADVAAFRRDVRDGDLSVAPQCRALASLAMAEAEVEQDTSGNSRLTKKNWRRRDDCAQAAILASGQRARRPLPAAGADEWFVVG